MKPALALTVRELRRTLPAALLAVTAVFAGHALAAEAPAETRTGPLTVSPVLADLGDMQPGARGTLEFTIANGADEEIRLTYIFAECDCSFDMPDNGVVPARDNFVLGASYHLDTAAGGRWDETITILTDHPRQREIHIPITAVVLPGDDARGSGRTGG